MIRRATILAAFVLVAAVQAITVTLSWLPSPSGEAVKGYVVYQSTNVTGPFVPVAWVGAATTNAFLDLTPARYFFYVTATNFWTESAPSETVGTPDPATKIQALKITK